MIKNIYSGNVIFNFDNAFFISNNTDTINNIEIDFGDGSGYNSLSLSNAKVISPNISIYYSTIGIKTISTKISYNSGNILYSSSLIDVKNASILSYDEVIPLNEVNPITAPPFLMPYQGNAYVIFGCGNNNYSGSTRLIRKPIIISNGFDPDNTNDIYSIANQQNLISRLNSQGYDVFLIRYASGAGYIEKNARVMVDLLNKIYANQQLSGTGPYFKPVIVGPSMGGIITRSAFDYLRSIGVDEKLTGMFVSFDSPHTGANIPLGDQYFFDFFANKAHNQGTIDSRTKLTTPAAREMLINYCSFFTPSSLYGSFYSSLGFPLTTSRKIAISNGNINGNSLFNPATQMINYSYNYGNWGTVAIADTWAVPNGSSNIFRGRFFDKLYIKPTHILYGVATYNETISISNNNTYLPLDGVAGGTYSINLKIVQNGTGGYGFMTTSCPNSCFIPLISAFKIPTSNLSYNVAAIPNYPYPHNTAITPFDAVYAQPSNEPHVTISASTANILMSEVSPDDLYLQNQNIVADASYHMEARNTIVVGYNVDPTLNRQLPGNYVVSPTGSVTLNAGTEIGIVQEAGFSLGSEAQLYIQSYPCAEIFRLKENTTASNTTKSYNKGAFSQNNFITKKQISADQNPYKIGIYPNPTQGKVSVNIFSPTQQNAVQLSIEDLTGKIVFMQTLDLNAGLSHNELNLLDLVNGVYFVKLNDSQGKLLKADKLMLNR
ncbi:MAG: T9SS type A sorting domain-containing protein [Bacteroidetes bacterium]|nr:T9SS type A sorting domain-containing protein [Bacteroidota bacterium]